MKKLRNFTYGGLLVGSMMLNGCASTKLPVSLPIDGLKSTRQMETTIADTSKLGDGVFVTSCILPNCDNAFVMYNNNGKLVGNLSSNFSCSEIRLDENGKPLYDISLQAMNEKGLETDKYVKSHEWIFGGKNDIVRNVRLKENAEKIAIISIDRETHLTKELFYLNDLLKGYDTKKNGGNWAHINSLALIKEKSKDGLESSSLLLSSREMSAIIKVNDIYNNPQIGWIMTENADLKKLGFPIMEKENGARPNLGQHTINFDKRTADGYYIYYFNNFSKVSYPNPVLLANPVIKFLYGFTKASKQGPTVFSSKSQSNFDFSNRDTVDIGKKSFIEKVFIDETNMQSKVVQSIEMPYSAIQSSAQYLENGNVVGFSSDTGILQEFDPKGEKLAEYKYNFKGAYRFKKLQFDMQNDSTKSK